jgi:hypothetical protein
MIHLIGVSLRALYVQLDTGGRGGRVSVDGAIGRNDDMGVIRSECRLLAHQMSRKSKKELKKKVNWI